MTVFWDIAPWGVWQQLTDVCDELCTSIIRAISTRPHGALPQKTIISTVFVVSFSDTPHFKVAQKLRNVWANVTMPFVANIVTEYGFLPTMDKLIVVGIPTVFNFIKTPCINLIKINSVMQIRTVRREKKN